MANSNDVMPKLRRWWLMTGFALMMFIMVLALIPMPEFVPGKLYSDKAGHLLAFAFLMLWFAGLFPRGQHWRVFLALLLYGVIMELLQSQVPNRYAEGADLLADVVGLCVGWLLARTALQRWPLWLEKLPGSLR